MTRCIAILALALTSTLFADQSSAEESGYAPAQQAPPRHADYWEWEILLDMGFSPEEADYILLSDFSLEIEVPFALIPLQIPGIKGE